MATQELKQTMHGQESCFVLIPWADFNLIVTSVKINSTKTISINQLVQLIIKAGK